MYPLSSRRDCSRILALASLELDAAASGLEQRRIARHRRRCADCDVTIARMADVTERVRSAVPVAPPVLVPAVPVRSHRRLGTPTLAAAAVAVMLATLAAMGALVSSADYGRTGAVRPISQSNTSVATDQRLVIELHQARSGHQLAAGPPSIYRLGQ